jgi:hypothetical protein
MALHAVPVAQSCGSSHGYGYGFSSLKMRKDRDWLDYATLAFVAALSVGLRFGGPSRFPFRGVLTQLPKPN